MRNRNLWIVVPAYNEEKMIGKMLDDLLAAGYQNIIVVDDGSSDDTLKIARGRPATLITHHFNRGVGAATQTGIELALKLGAQIIVTIDADCQHDVGDIEKLVLPIEQGRAEVVLGSRFKKKTKVPTFNKLANKFGNLITWILFGLKVSDSQSGFKAFSRKAAKTIKISTNGYEACSEVIREIAWYKLRYAEVPIAVYYSKYSKAKGQNLATGLVTLIKLIIRTLMR